jgi:hypothetical protein
MFEPPSLGIYHSWVYILVPLFQVSTFMMVARQHHHHTHTVSQNGIGKAGTNRDEHFRRFMSSIPSLYLSRREPK